VEAFNQLDAIVSKMEVQFFEDGNQNNSHQDSGHSSK
jgi:hypothetical protein